MISVLTSTYNRKLLLPLIYESLQNQKYKNFEWIIGDDGSDDNTEELITDYIKLKQINIKYIKSKNNLGKSSIDNRMMLLSTGDYIIWCDSDEVFVENTLSDLIEMWHSIFSDKNEYIFMSGAIYDKDIHNIHSDIYDSSTFDCSLKDFKKFERITGDGPCLFNACLLRNHLFPEIDMYVPESRVFMNFYNHKIIYKRKIMKLGSKIHGGITNNNNLKYSEGFAEYFSFALNYLGIFNFLRDLYPHITKINLYSLMKIVTIFDAYITYSFYGSRRFIGGFMALNSILLQFFYLSIFPFSMLKIMIKPKKIIKTYNILNKNKINNNYKVFY